MKFNNKLRLLLKISLIFNFLIAGYALLLYKSSISSLNEEKRINQIQVRNTELLGEIFKNKIKKDELLTILKSKVNSKDFFDKPQENGIGLGTMFLRFDKNGYLVNIEAHSFEGP